ncbi:MAG: two-component system, cell cycle response regulator [Kribbellaceae bacterium]|jgi:diguanylate cyclase (GGDEF)-like protein|nr:two-component system, cell cycle response regulator [Kribbellaceae bacterium]
MSADATVLVVDDSLTIRAVVRSRLEEEGYRVAEAADGSAALDWCRQSPPDVVLLDVEMPGLSGHQVLARLKSDAALRDIPVVFLTGRTSMDDVLAGLRGGAHDYLKKPFEPEELVARIGAAAHVKKLQDQLREQNVRLERVSRTDILTGLYNRRHLEEELERYHRAARRNHDNLGVILLDIDMFKQVNDTFGHGAGDRILCTFADRLRSQLRAGDVAGRWGGEEFLVLLPGADLQATHQVAERIRAVTAASAMPAEGHAIIVTVSGGCVVEPDATTDELLSTADSRLYAAKHAGRNLVVATGGPVSDAN